MLQREVCRLAISNREAVVVEGNDGYRVQLFEDGKLQREANVTAHTLRYAEDCAENWVYRFGWFRSNDS